MIRSALVALALLAPFWFPYPLTLALSFAASLSFPPSALLAGALAEALYHAPGMKALPVAFLSGCVLSGLALLVRRFAASRIMGA